MKPLQIGLLVVAGALCGAVVMRVAERPQRAVPVVTAEVPPDPAPAAPAPPATSTAPAEPAAARAAPVAQPAATPPTPEPATASIEAHETAPRRPSPFDERHSVKPRPAWQRELHPQPTMTARVTPPPVPQTARPVTPPPAEAPAAVQAPPAPIPPPAREPENATPPAPAAPTSESESIPQAAPPLSEPNRATLSAGMLIPVRLADGLTSERNQPGDTFQATLEKELVADGFVIAERGARVDGVVVAADRGGKVSGVASLAVVLTRIHTSDGQAVPIQTDAFNRHASATHTQDAEKVGGAAAFGAIIGAIAGGGKGAAAGAGVGAGAGAGAVLLSRGAPAALPAEMRLTFRLRIPVTITERR